MSVEINATNFPDEKFRGYVYNVFDRDHDYILSDAEILLAKELVSSSYSGSYEYALTRMASAQGIEYLTSLETINIFNNPNLTALDVSQNLHLKNLHCEQCAITAIDVSHNPELEQLYADRNPLASVILGDNPALVRIDIETWHPENGVITELDVSRCPNLESLNIDSQGLTTIDVTNCPKLHYLSARGTEITQFDIRNNQSLISIYRTGDQSIGGEGDSRYKYYGNTHDTDYINRVALIVPIIRGTNTYAKVIDGPMLAIDATNFPDQYLREHITARFDKDGDGYLDSAELKGATYINVGKANCRTLEGISLLPYLTKVTLGYSENADTLATLAAELAACENLEEIAATSWTGSSLDVSGCTKLKKLSVMTESLTLGEHPELVQLSCWKYNAPFIGELDISGCPKLMALVYDANTSDTARFRTYRKSDGWAADFFSYTRGTSYVDNSGTTVYQAATEKLEFNIATALDPDPMQPTDIKFISAADAGDEIYLKETADGKTGLEAYIYLGLDESGNARLLRKNAELSAPAIVERPIGKAPVSTFDFNYLSGIVYTDRSVEIMEQAKVFQPIGNVINSAYSYTLRNRRTGIYKIVPKSDISTVENGVRLGVYRVVIPDGGGLGENEAVKYCATNDANGITVNIQSNHLLMIGLYAHSGERVLHQTIELEVYKDGTRMEDPFASLNSEAGQQASYTREYENSAIDMWLNGSSTLRVTKTFLDRFDTATLETFAETNVNVIGYEVGQETQKTLLRRAFLPSGFELGIERSGGASTDRNYGDALEAWAESDDGNTARQIRQEAQYRRLVLFIGNNIPAQGGEQVTAGEYLLAQELDWTGDALDESNGCLYWTRSTAAAGVFVAINRDGSAVNISGYREDIHPRPMIALDPEAQIGKNAYGDYSLITSTASTPPVITAQPQAANVTPGSMATFGIGAIGSDISYQWQESEDGTVWTDISGANENSYTVRGAYEISGFQYRCKLSNGNGTTTSNAAAITVEAEARTTTPASLSLSEGQSGIFSIQSAGYDVGYQWQVKISGTWTDIQYATNPTYEIYGALTANGNQYRCKVDTGGEELYSEPATLYVSESETTAAPVISVNPVNATVDEGQTATFTVAAEGDDLSYQWQVQKDGGWQSIQGATGTSYSVVGTRQLNGSKYRCLVANAAGAVYSLDAVLTVNQQSYISTPRILTQPRSATVALGDTVSFIVRADGGELSYQWQRLNGGQWYDLTGQTASACILTATSDLDGTQYRCAVSNTAGTTYTNIVLLSLTEGPIVNFYGYHSIIISGKNTYGEWEMYPTSRPHIAPPEVKTSYVDLPGADGGIDYTDLLTGEPRYGYRKGSWEFLLIPQDKWASVYRSLVSFLHGKVHTVILEDDPNYVYTGRLSVNEWQSAAHNSLITIDYILEPFPKNISGEDPSESDEEVLNAAERLLRKPENSGMVIGIVNNTASIIDPAILFPDGDSIAY